MIYDDPKDPRAQFIKHLSNAIGAAFSGGGRSPAGGGRRLGAYGNRQAGNGGGGTVIRPRPCFCHGQRRG